MSLVCLWKGHERQEEETWTLGEYGTVWVGIIVTCIRCGKSLGRTYHPEPL